jgi:hypothetical protein
VSLPSSGRRLWAPMLIVQSPSLYLVIPRPGRSQIHSPRMPHLWLDPLRHRPSHHPRYFQHVQGRPQALLGHLW